VQRDKGARLQYLGDREPPARKDSPMRITIGAFVLLFAMTRANAYTTKDLEGCWLMQALTTVQGDQRSEPFGPSPVGQVLFTSDGRFSNIQMRPDLPDEYQQTANVPVTTLLAYFGAYKVENDQLLLSVTGSSVRAWRNQTLTRTISKLTANEIEFLDHPHPDMSASFVIKRC
jgi:lipocalin-like protein